MGMSIGHALLCFQYGKGLTCAGLGGLFVCRICWLDDQFHPGRCAGSREGARLVTLCSQVLRAESTAARTVSAPFSVFYLIPATV
jgi:hypothetical protein